MAKVIFTLGGDDFTFSKGRDYPINDVVVVNVVYDISESGEMYCYDKGIAIKRYSLFYKNLTITDYTNVEDWIENICVGPLNEFTYTDESSVTHTVRCLNTENPLSETASGMYSGTIKLREER